MEECLEHPWLKDEADMPRAIVGVGFDANEVASDDDSDSDDSSGVNGLNGVNGVNGVNGHNGHNGVNGCNGTNGTHDEDEGENLYYQQAPAVHCWDKKE